MTEFAEELCGDPQIIVRKENLRVRVKLHPDKELAVKKKRIDGVPTLILSPTRTSRADIAVLWIHGGGYFLGMKEMVYMSRADELVRKYGVTVFSPGYTLTWQKPYPAAVNDCYAVLAYMDAHRDEFSCRRLMVGGESAGGGLCAADRLQGAASVLHLCWRW